MPDILKVEEGVTGALELDPADRAAWLRDFCGNDRALLAEIDSLLNLEREAASFMEEPAVIPSTLLEPEEDHGKRSFGKYTILKEVGQGGMGAVFLAERNDGQFSKLVAVKIVRQTIAEKEVIERFERERQILANLNHRNIAALFDGGVSDSGEPYIVMEYVDGLPLTDHVSGKGLHDRLKIFLKVCDAVSFAHRHLVIHRDIKPSNILVEQDDEPKLLDFGLAKALDGSNPEADRTQTEFRALTPGYASPEQLRGEIVSTSTDIYSLGVVLYELLTGSKPFDTQSKSLDEVIKVVSGSIPPAPSSINALSSHGRAMSNISADLDNITMMALRKEPERRYRSVEEFASDIERFLDNRPVKARPSTVAYRFRKFVERNKVAVAAAGVLLIAIVAGLGTTIWQATVARRERDLANVQRAKADKISQFLLSALTYSDPTASSAGSKNKKEATISEMLDDFAPRLTSELVDQPDVLAPLERAVGLAYMNQSRLESAEQYLSEALKLDLNLYGESSQETAFTLSSLAGLYSLKGDYPRAQGLLERAVVTYKAYPPTDPLHAKAYVSALNISGAVHWTLGDFPKAEQAYSESFGVASSPTVGDRQLAAGAQAGLGLTRYAQGRLDESVSLLKQAIEQYRSIPTARFDLPDALNALGQALTWKGEYVEAVNTLRESEQLSLEIYGEPGLSFPRALWLEVYALCFSGKCKEAAAPLEKADELYARYLPDNKVYRANIYNARCIYLTRTGQPELAEVFGRKAVESYSQSQLPGAPSLTLARIDLADSLIAQNKAAEAEQLLNEAVTEARAGQGTEHWRTKYAEQKLQQFLSRHRGGGS
jgi:eukaryotic-like serine/threonine-protein kinase